jgi:hypothetical protein
MILKSFKLEFCFWYQKINSLITLSDYPNQLPIKKNGNENTNENNVCFFGQIATCNLSRPKKKINFYAFIRWAGVDPDSYLKERKKRIETKKKGSKVDNKNSFKRQATVIFIKFLIDSK